jgi:molybdopterin synthase sulfur carrier subunit
MSEYKVRAFGITKDILGGKEAVIKVTNGTTVSALRHELNTRYPQLLGLRSLYIAVNNEYADDDKVLTSADEIALIPPVSGG